LERLVADERIQAQRPTPEQLAMLARVRRALGVPGNPRLAAVSGSS